MKGIEKGWGGGREDSKKKVRGGAMAYEAPGCSIDDFESNVSMRDGIARVVSRRERAYCFVSVGGASGGEEESAASLLVAHEEAREAVVLLLLPAGGPTETKNKNKRKGQGVKERPAWTFEKEFCARFFRPRK